MKFRVGYSTVMQNTLNKLLRQNFIVLALHVVKAHPYLAMLIISALCQCSGLSGVLRIFEIFLACMLVLCRQVPINTLRQPLSHLRELFSKTAH